MDLSRGNHYFVWLAVLCLAAVAAGQVKMPQLPVYVEDSDAAQDVMLQAEELRAQDRLTEAATAYQQVIDQFPNKLLSGGSGSGVKIYRDAPRQVFEELIADGELLAAYRRLEEPAAQAALAAAGTDTKALRGVVARYRACAAGLEAGLRLAGLELERGNATDAGAVLDDFENHPDMKTAGARWELLEGAVGVFGDDPARLAKHQAGLHALHDAKAEATLAAWAGSRERIAGRVIWDSMGQLPGGSRGAEVREEPGSGRPGSLELPKDLSQPLWKIAMPESAILDSARANLSRFNGVSPSDHVGPPVLRIAPIACGRRLYINSGLSVQAVDSASGREVWTYENPDPTSIAANPMLWTGGIVADQRGVMIGDDRVAAVVGYAVPGPMNWQLRSPGTALVSLSMEDGHTLWRVEPKDIDPSLASAFFHGTPVADGGRVLVMLRRSQMSGFQDAYVVAIDAASGEVLWRRYLSSAVAFTRGGGGPLGYLFLSGGRLYVSDDLGAAACLDSRSGAMHWLTLLPGRPTEVEMFSPQRRVVPGGEDHRPVLVAAGLLVPGIGQNGPACLLDPASGKKIRELPGDEWTMADYLMPAGGDVLSVGTITYLIDGKTLQTRWRWRSELQPLGRVAVLPDRLLVPVINRVVVIRLSNGEVITQLPLDTPGSLLALPNQMIAADAAAVSSYMDWPQAYGELKREAADSPDDPAPGLGLAYLAVNQHQADAALEGVDAALAAMKRDAEAEDTTFPGGARSNEKDPHRAALKREVVQQILALATSNNAAAPLKSALFDRLANATASPADEVSYQLAFGAFLVSEGKPEEAVDHYQAVLADPTLSAQLYQQGTVSRQAGLEAKVRLAALVKEAGPKIYERYEAAAAQRLTELTTAARDPAALIELARQYPLSKSAPAALVAAAEQLATAGDTGGAIAQFRAAYDRQPDQPLLQKAVGRLVELYESSNHVNEAKHWLNRARRDHPGLQPLRNGQPIDTAIWLAELASRPSGQTPLPVLATPLAGSFVIPARLLTPVAQPEQSWPRDRIITHVPGSVATPGNPGASGKIQLRRGPALDVAWEADVPAGPAALLSLTQDQAVVWLDHDVVMSLDAQTGKPLWQVDAKTTLDEVGAPQKQGGTTPEQRRFMDLINNPVIPGRRQAADEGPGYMVRVSDAVICLADRGGRAVGIDRRTGHELWRLLCPVERLTLMNLNDDALVLAGLTGTQTDAPSSTLMVLDPVTGETRLPAMDDKRPILWASVSADGLLLSVTATEAVAHHLSDGNLAWRIALTGDIVTPIGPDGGELLFVRELTLEDQRREEALLVIDTSNGQVVNRLADPAADLRSPPQVRSVEQDWHLLRADQAIDLGPDGLVRWRDAVAYVPDRQYQRQLIGEDRLAVLAGTRPAGVEEMARRFGAGLPPRIILRGGPMQGNIVIQNQLRRVNIAPNAPAEINGDREAVTGPAGEWDYRLYIFDRHSGVLLDEQPLGPLPTPIDPRHAVFLDNRLVFGTAAATVVVKGK